MPIQEKDLGKYKRPGIYINEIDNSIVETPAQNVLINLVPGFSKKGPYNKPVYVDNKVDFERIYGTIDKQLENKGSFFHRTCEKMLETGPIWALNLLSTVPNRDVLNYVSVSTSALYSNSNFSNQYQADYERFFNRQDFWTRDEDSFQDLVDDTGLNPNNLLNFTNMGDKMITVFIFKSNVTGFDITATSWYGSETKVPTYIDPKSLISDYMVDVLILSGDWTDYKTLSVDSTWSKYFTLEGLIIDELQDFVNETGVVVLANYDVCLIPNFKDANNRDMYIESVINNNTDKTSLFCTYNQDLLLDNNYLSDLVDLIGNTIVGLDVESINFLSYNQSIKETIEYPLVKLDSANNVFGNVQFGSQTHEWNNWTQTGITNFTFNPATSGISYTLSAAQYIINGRVYPLPSANVTVSTVAGEYKRLDVLYLDATGLHIMDGIAVASGITSTPREITFSNNNTIILGTVEVFNTGGTYVNGVYLGGTYSVGPYTTITDSNDTVAITTLTGFTGSENWLKIEFLGTSGLTALRNNEYARLRAHKVYNEIALALETNKGVIIDSGGTIKTSILIPTINPYSTKSNDQILIYLDTPADYTTTNTVLLYFVDKQFKLSASCSGATTTYDLSAPNIVAKYSDFYTDFIDGIINTDDKISGTTNKLTMYVDSVGILTLNLDYSIDGTNGLSIITDIGNWKQTIEIESYEGNDQTNIVAIKVNKDRYSEIVKGTYLEAYYDTTYYEAYGEGYTLGDSVPRKLVRIVNIKNDTVDTSLKILYTDGPINISTIITGTSEMYTTAYPAVYKYATNLKGIGLKPFIIHQDSIPNGTENRQNTILNVLSKDTAIYKGLINKNKISWRYLIDAFGLGLTENSKQQYVDLCGAKLSCFGFINMPSAKAFKKSNNPNFVNNDGSLSTTYIKEGANQELNPDFLYTFGDGVGRSTVGYFFPYAKVTADSISSFVPPAAYVATAYMRKFTTSIAGTTPWTIIAGVNMGRVPDISGTEMDFSNDDLDNFAEMGCNPITYIRNVGYIINDENTAQVYPISALSYIHSREVLIELENELYDMLLRYQWKFNTPTIRSEIKYRADKICQSFVDSVGLYAYKNVIDETNNTNYIIDLQGGVLDTYIEIVRGMGWIVNNITIERTGTINSTGFQQ
jgi:hypothetical protein